MNELRQTLGDYIRRRSRQLGLTRREVCRRARISPQTLYSLDEVPQKLPSLPTVVALADVLNVHPLRLLHLVFDEVGLPREAARERKRGDQSAFVRDVTVPDGHQVSPGQRFVKTWEMQNVGCIPWEGRFLQCLDEELVVYTRTGEMLELAHNLIPSSRMVPIPLTPPGELVQISVEFTAPEPPGTVLSYWKSVFEDGSLCFPEARGLWVKVRVCQALTGAFELRCPP